MIWLAGRGTSNDPGVPIQIYIPNYKVSICLILSCCKFFLKGPELLEVGSPWPGCFP